MDIEDIAERLLEERVRLGYNQSAFARLLGISRETLRLIELGSSVFKVDILASAAMAGVDIQYVVTGVRSTNTKRIEDQIGYEKAAFSNSNISGIGSISGVNVNIVNTAHHRTVTKAETHPGIEHITIEQRSTLKRLVDEITTLEKAVKTQPKSYRSVWAALNRHCKVNTYTLIPLSEYEHAEKFLRMWIGRLNSGKKAPTNDGDQWRKRYYSYIKVNTRQPDEQEKLISYMERNFGVKSLTELDNNELQKVYSYVAGLKQRRQ